MPNFWIALMFGAPVLVKLGWLPRTASWDKILTSCPALQCLSRHRHPGPSDALEHAGVIRSDYITTARAKGMSEFRILSGCLPNALLPVITVIGTAWA